jgi:ribonucleoside-diphosphate reductase alpha chain
MSVPDAIGIAIEKWMQEKQGVQQDLLAAAPREVVARPTPSGLSAGGLQAQPGAHARSPELLGACPDCGSQLEFAEGCVKCHVCGYSECG